MDRETGYLNAEFGQLYKKTFLHMVIPTRLHLLRKLYPLVSYSGNGANLLI